MPLSELNPAAAGLLGFAAVTSPTSTIVFAHDTLAHSILAILLSTPIPSDAGSRVKCLGVQLMQLPGAVNVTSLWVHGKEGLL